MKLKTRVYDGPGNDGKLIEVTPSGRFKFYGFEFFVWRTDRRSSWSVVEVSSGMGIPSVERCGTIDKAVQDAQDRIKHVGRLALKKYVANSIAKYGRAN